VFRKTEDFSVKSAVDWLSKARYNLRLERTGNPV